MIHDLANTDRTLALECMGKTFEHLGREMSGLGANLSIWDDQGARAEPFGARCEFCQVVYSSDGPCERAMAGVARSVLAGQGPARGECELGCCVVGVPIRQRRRLAGAAVACLPTREMLDQESLARLADRRQLDAHVLTGYAEAACRTPRDAGELLLRVLEKLLAAEQAAQVAQDELGNFSVNLATTYEELSLLYRISGSMRVTQKPEGFLQTVCDELREVMNIQLAAAFVRPGRPGDEEDVVVQAGPLQIEPGEIRALAAREILPRFGPNKRAVLDNHLRCQGAAGLTGLIAVPLVSDTAVMGALIGANKNLGEFDSVDLKLISSIGNQAEVFLANSRLYADMQELLMGALHALTATIDAKDPYTCGHSQRVAMLSRRLAEAMGMNAQRAQEVYLSGLLHDIGKIGVPEATLRKEGRLTDEEYRQMKRHPMLGAKILAGIRPLEGVIAGIRHHHERPDGRGYPDGLTGQNVPVEGLIVGLADCFDAMTSDRTYRKALPLDVVAGEIRKHAGTQFDARLVELLLAMDLEALLLEIRQPAQVLFPMNLHTPPRS